jgi:putative acetyltransferase
MKSLLKILRNQGIKRVELSVEADNLAGEKFYKKLGFELEGRFKNWFKRENDNFYVDELIMAKSLFL